MLGHRKLELADYLQMLKRRKWLILLPLLLFPILGGVSTMFMQPRYRSQTLVLIDQQKVPDDYVKPVVSSDLDSRLASMREQILSRSRLQPIIERYNLYGNQRISLDDKIELARKNIAIEPIHSRITNAGGLPGFFIFFTAADPRTAQLICGEVTTLFVNANLKAREEMTEGTTDFLKSQLDDAKRALDDQDAKLAAFQRQNMYMGQTPDQGSPNVGMLTSLNTQLEAVNQDVSRLEQNKQYGETMLAQLAPTTASGAPAQVMMPNPQKALKEAEVTTLETQETELLSHYTPDYPDVINTRRRLAEARKSAAATPDMIAAKPLNTGGAGTASGDSPAVIQMKAQLRAADMALQSKRAEQTMLRGQIGTYQARIANSPLVEQQYKQLTRDNDTAKQFYNDLLTKMNHSRMATALETQMQGEQFHVMDQPNLPEAPIFPRRGMFVGAGLAAGLLLGLGLAALLEWRDTSLRTERDIVAVGRVPLLATITLGEDTINLLARDGKGNDKGDDPGRSSRLRKRRKPHGPPLAAGAGD